jgi:hypothetical protein
MTALPADKPLVLGTHTLKSRLIVGTGKYATLELMQECLEASGSDVITVAELTPEAVGRYAAERALSRLGSRKIPTIECPVLFESPVAAGLLGGFVQAVSGGSLYRKTSFLVDSMGKQVFPKHIDILEDPHVLRGKGSSPFDDEGVRGMKRKVVSGGRVEGYFLSTYSDSPSNYIFMDGKLKNLLSNQTPIFIHDNGWNYGSPKFINHFNLIDIS